MYTSIQLPLDVLFVQIVILCYSELDERIWQVDDGVQIAQKNGSDSFVFG